MDNMWELRAMKPTRIWASAIEPSKMGAYWKKIVNSVKTKPMTTLATCRAGPVLSSLESLASNTYVPPSLGKFEILPGAKTSIKVGGFEYEFDENSLVDSTIAGAGHLRERRLDNHGGGVRDGDCGKAEQYLGRVGDDG